MEEYIELYGKDKQPTGVVIARGEACPPGNLFPVVCVWVIDEAHNFLVTERSAAKKASPLKWENPGGACRSGETLAQGAARELAEETGVVVAPEDLTEVACEVQYGCLVITFAVHMNRPRITLQEGETSDYRWVSEKELIRMCQKKRMAEPIERQIWHYRSKLKTM